MPKSDDIFGVQGGTTAGMSDTLPAGMFPSMGNMQEPTPEDMEEAMKKVRYGKYARVKAFHVDTFDLSGAKDRKRYVETVLELYQALAEKKGVIGHLEKKLWMTGADSPKMIVHLEWYEYVFGMKDYMQDEKKSDKRGKRPGPGA